MVNSVAAERTFSALADPTRCAIVERLARGEASVTELAAPFDMTLPGILKHVRVLEGAGIVRRRKIGRIHYCRLEPLRLRDASAWLERQRARWDARLDRLERHLARQEAP